MKDYFSTQSALYAQFRPTYPAELFDYMLSLVKEKHTAWDCATGNGQVAKELAKYFNHVFATDISENQLKNAMQQPNITYAIAPAEKTTFKNEVFDLITVAQAIHWFNFNEFYTEVKRTLKPDGLVAVIGYGLMYINPAIDALIHKFYEDILGPFWDEERRYITEHYQTIPFPFHEIKTPNFTIKTKWPFEQLVGYLNTWSALQHYMQMHNQNPMDFILEPLKETWGNAESREVNFPILLRLGKIN